MILKNLKVFTFRGYDLFEKTKERAFKNYLKLKEKNSECMFCFDHVKVKSTTCEKCSVLLIEKLMKMKEKWI